MNVVDLKLIKVLVSLSPQTTREISARINVKQPNFMAALTGTRNFPKSTLEPLLEILGVPNNAPDFNRVHFWIAGLDLTALQYAVSKFFPNGAQIGGLWRQGGGIWDLRRALDQQMFVIYDERCLVIVKRTGLGTFMPTAKPIGPETISGLRWRGGKVGAETMVSIPTDKYQQWSEGKDITTEEVLSAIALDSGVGWQEVIQMMIDLGITPAGAMDIVHEWHAAQVIK